MKRICVIDGQGGGIGSVVIKRLSDAYNETVEIVALGTNAIATTQMLKAGANRITSKRFVIVQDLRLRVARNSRISEPLKPPAANER